MSVSPNSGDGGGDDGGGVLPTWLPTSLSGFRELLGALIMIMAVEWYVDLQTAVIGAFASIYDAALFALSPIAPIIRTFGDVVVGVFWWVVNALWLPAETLATSTGPFAPVLVTLYWAAVAIVMIWIARKVVLRLIIAISPIP